MKWLKLNQSGVVLTSIVVTLPPLILITALFLQLAVNGFSVARKDQVRTHAQFGADAAVDYAIKELNNNCVLPCAVLPTVLLNNGDVRVTFEALVLPISLSSRTIHAVGKTYRPANNLLLPPVSEVKLKVNVRSVVGGEYSVVAGAGGLKLTNSAKILGGDVFVNGRVELYNTSQIGLSLNPVTLDVANQNCPVPADASFPRLCNAGENIPPQPIKIDSCNNNPQIYGTVRANHQSDGGPCMTNPGLTATSGVIPNPLPDHDRAGQIAAINPAALIVPDLTDGPPYEGWDCGQGGVFVWPANLKISGDVRLRQNCSVTLLGDVWITGKLEIENTSIMTVSDLVGGTRVNIMVDGQKVTIKNSATIMGNLQGTGAQIITYWSTALCSPGCGSVTGVDLFNSSAVVTIELDNSATAPQSIFYSRWTKVLIKNSGAIGAIAGQAVELNNSGAITFGSAVGSGKTSWVIEDYRRQF